MLEELRANLARVMQILGVHSVGAAHDYRPVLGRSRLRVEGARRKSSARREMARPSEAISTGELNEGAFLTKPYTTTKSTKQSTSDTS